MRNFWGYNALVSEQLFLCLGAKEAFSNFPPTVPGALSAGPIKTVASQLSLISSARINTRRRESQLSPPLDKEEQTLLSQS